MSEKMKKVLLMRGLQGSGKTTYAKELVSNDKSWKRVSRDDLRKQLDNEVFNPKNEKFITIARDQIIHAALNNGYNVVVDETGFNPETVKAIREIAESHDAVFEIRYIDTKLSVCLDRNSKRPNPVPKEAIIALYNKYVAPNSEKTQDAVVLPKCIVVDLDGTAASIAHRNPFDTGRCYEDSVNTPVQSVVKAMMSAGYQVIFVSGREEKFRELSEKWLKDKFFAGVDGYTPLLYMRKTEDFRNDAIIKIELYEEHIIGKYHIEFVLDDRNRVVDAIREIGLTVFQVAPGNF